MDRGTESRIFRWISTLLILAIFCATQARAATPIALSSRGVRYDFEEVPEDEANRIAPLPKDFWENYRLAGERISPSESFSPDLGTIEVGIVVLDALVNLGKTIWQVIEKGRPVVDIQTDVANAVPQGIKHWSELSGWNDPVSKLYRCKLLRNQTRSLGDIYFRLVFVYGGSYQGKGRYLANVTVLPAQIFVPYARSFYARSNVTELLNQGTKEDPLAGMTLLLKWGMNSFTLHTEQDVTLHVKADGTVLALPGADDRAEDVDAPIKKLN